MDEKLRRYIERWCILNFRRIGRADSYPKVAELIASLAAAARGTGLRWSDDYHEQTVVMILEARDRLRAKKDRSG